MNATTDSVKQQILDRMEEHLGGPQGEAVGSEVATLAHALCRLEDSQR